MLIAAAPGSKWRSAPAPLAAGPCSKLPLDNRSLKISSFLWVGASYEIRGPRQRFFIAGPSQASPPPKKKGAPGKARPEGSELDPDLEELVAELHAEGARRGQVEDAAFRQAG